MPNNTTIPNSTNTKKGVIHYPPNMDIGPSSFKPSTPAKTGGRPNLVDDEGNQRLMRRGIPRSGGSIRWRAFSPNRRITFREHMD